MPSQSKTESPTPSARVALQPAGVVPSVVSLALDVVDRSGSTAIAVLGDARVELRAAVDQTIDLAEKLATGAFRFARKTVSRFDDATSETLAGVERVLGGAVRSARETSRAAAELATTTAASVTSPHVASA